MKVTVVAVGHPGSPLADAIDDYEMRAARYWKLETIAVREERARKSRSVGRVREAEAERLRARIPDDTTILALTRTGTRWSSERLARFLGEQALRSSVGATFVLGGAYGLGPSLLSAADHRISLSDFTMPHELARLVLAEQLYRAGTIVRGEPYHKGGA